MEKSLFPGYTIGVDAYEDIRNVCPAYGKKVAVIGGEKALAAAKDKILKAMEGTGLEVVGVFWYGGEASMENIEMLRPKAAEADMIFAVGGGKAIDTCKVLAHDTHRPFFTFPTIASTCASCTSLGIVYHPDGSLREYSFSKIPPITFSSTRRSSPTPRPGICGPAWGTPWPSTTSAPSPPGTMFQPTPTPWASP